MTTTVSVPLDELVCLFTGVPDETGWATTPCHSVKLALEVARRVDPQTLVSLRERFYDTSPVDEIPGTALQAIHLAFQRYRYLRDRRGL